MAQRRGYGEGSIKKMPNGRWRARVRLGRDVVNGKDLHPVFYGDTKGEAQDKMQRAIQLYEKGKDDEAMDIFMEVLVRGDPAEKALANLDEDDF